MVKKKLIGAAGRYGSRYGQRVKRKIADIEGKQRKKQTCPFCNKKINRMSKGIWQCKKCKRKFAAHAYYIDKETIKVKAEMKEKPKKEKKQTKVETKQTKTKKSEKKKTKSEAKKTSKKSTTKSKPAKK
jgi:large subunit ribosomal protein L37Ae